MVDVYCEWNSDLIVTPNGSVQTAINWDETRERIIRMIITNSAQTLPDGSTTAPDYIFSPDFGYGLGALVDQNPTGEYVSDLKRRITQGVSADPNINPAFPPNIVFNRPSPTTVEVYIGVKLINGQPGAVSVTLGSNT